MCVCGVCVCVHACVRACVQCACAWRVWCGVCVHVSVCVCVCGVVCLYFRCCMPKVFSLMALIEV